MLRALRVHGIPSHCQRSGAVAVDGNRSEGLDVPVNLDLACFRNISRTREYMPLRDGFFSTATQTSCCNRIQRSNRVRLLVVSTHDFPDMDQPDKVANPAHGQLNRENEYSPVPVRA